ncbi:MAG: citramalate synthase [Syntrophomonadaceae bacterium]|nr:citramalate synthase [Syntrophomonadaceae bacterium]
MDVEIYDTTLRDGSQGEGMSLSLEDKLKIARKLDYLGVSYIEGGWPGSNPKDMDFFKMVQDIEFKHAKIVAFSSTRKADSKAQKDSNIQALLDAGVKTVTIFGKSWDFHVIRALETTLEENLAMVEDTIAYLKAKGLEVIFDAEHFFDGYKNNQAYALRVLKAAEQAGADLLVLCDTNGGALPWEIDEIIAQVMQNTSSRLGIHAHNDSGTATANSIIAVRRGCCQVQGTVNGYGERCGNADLCEIVPNLELKLGLRALPPDHLTRISEVSHYVSEIANMPHHSNQPFVGSGAFTHKAGIHVSALLKDALTYEHINPETVGNHRRVLVSELSGLSNLLYKAREFGLDVDKYDADTRKVIRQIKELENEGFQFEGAEASLELFLRKAFGQTDDFFSLKNMKIILEKNEDEIITSEAMIKIEVGETTYHTVAEGDGPVNALDNSLRKALTQVYPEIADMHLSDYKVRVLDGENATAARVRVLIDSADCTGTWSTVGVSENIIEASWQALVDSVNYLLMKKRLDSDS